MRGILIIDDEEEIRELLAYNLERNNFSIFLAANGEEGLSVLKEHKNSIDLILLDVMMPIMGGMEFCKVVRGNPVYDDILICFLTARNEDYIQVEGLDAGADDYISKPLKPAVLISRINALLRRKAKKKEELELAKGSLVVDRKSYTVRLKEEEIQLPRKEFELLAFLSSQPGVVVTREEILQTVWGDGVVVGDRTIDVHIRKLREKIGKEYIQTVKGVGYKFLLIN